MQQGLTMETGTIVDATLIAAPSSTKNAAGKRDEQMSNTRKGNQWHLVIKASGGGCGQRIGSQRDGDDRVGA